MAEIPDWLAKEMESLRRLRDEAKLQLHLGKADAQEAFQEVEKRWQHLEARLKVIREETRGDLAEIGEAAKLLTRQIRDGYRHLKTLL
jgi:cell fate (sporulation/competence/biofilm development) regulator YmcA (YheA/YmcA/DUF963 family)